MYRYSGIANTKQTVARAHLQRVQATLLELTVQRSVGETQRSSEPVLLQAFGGLNYYDPRPPQTAAPGLRLRKKIHSIAASDHETRPNRPRRCREPVHSPEKLLRKVPAPSVFWCARHCRRLLPQPDWLERQHSRRHGCVVECWIGEKSSLIPVEGNG
jgi:hypothetical protein